MVNLKNIFKIDEFKSEVDKFCESHLWEDKKEYFNTLSALVISGFGFYGLSNNSSNFIINLLYSFLISNGIFSALNHWYGIDGWKYADGLTMLLPVSIGLLYLLNFMTTYSLISGSILKLVYILAPLILFIPIFMEKYSNIFEIVFLIISLSLLSFIPIALKIKNLVLQKNHYIIDFALQRFKRGALFVVIVAILWFGSEPFCKCQDISNRTKKLIAMTCTHVFWHIFSGYGFYLMIDSFDRIASL